MELLEFEKKNRFAYSQKPLKKRKDPVLAVLCDRSGKDLFRADSSWEVAATLGASLLDDLCWQECP